MTTRPRLRTGPHLLPGLIAIALFVVFAIAILRSSFGDPAGFPEDASIVANIGFALLDIDAGGVPVEGFLVAFIAVAVVLDAALDGAVMLARQEVDDSARTDGGDVETDGDVVETDGGTETNVSGVPDQGEEADGSGDEPANERANGGGS